MAPAIEPSASSDLIAGHAATVVEAILTLARLQPTAPALHVLGAPGASFGDLAAQFGHIKERFDAWGIKRGDIVAGMIEDRPAMARVLALVPGVATFAPLAPTFPIDEYRRLFERMCAKAVLLPAGSEHAARAAARLLGIAEIDLVAEPDGSAGAFTLRLARSTASLARAAAADHAVAWVLTSSGTTGRSKLLPAEHQPMLLRAAAMRRYLQLSPADLGCHVMPLHFGNGLRTQLMTPLLAGASIACLPEQNVTAFFAALDELPVTFFAAGFSFFREILRRAPDYKDALARSRLRFLRASQGRLDVQEIEQLEQLFRAPLLAAYSSTEAGDIAHDPLPPRSRKRGAVGLPQSSEVAIMGGDGAMLPRGATGEIVVRGAGVFRGYLDDAEMTRASFAGDWFRTGDTGYFDDDGYVFLLGRIKDVISRGGEKISPVEIDLAIQALPDVKEAAAFAVPHPTLGEEVVAAVVLQPNRSLSEARILDHVRHMLGPRKVPRRIYFLDALPHTGSGKLRRAAIAEALGLDRTMAAPATAAASSPLEAAITGLWSSLLKVPVGCDDDFFLLGGDSLRGTQLLAQAEAVFGVTLSIQSLFEDASTVAGMARKIDALRRKADADATGADSSRAGRSVIAKRATTNAPIILSATQQRAWFLTRLDPDGTVYNEARAYRLRGVLDIAALRASLEDIVVRHDILRTTYAVIDEEPRQIIHDDMPLELTVLDLAEAKSDRPDEAVEAALEKHAAKPFDLERGPLARFLVLCLSDGDHVLQRVWHHIVSDERSAQILETELSAFYRVHRCGEASTLTQLPAQYADYALWQEQSLNSAALAPQLQYWKTKLDGVATLDLPCDHIRPAVQSYRGNRLRYRLPPSAAQRLRGIGQAQGATFFMAALAVFKVLLHRYTGSDDIVVGTPIASRNRLELEALIGYFANTLVLRTDLAGEPSFRALLTRLRETAVEAYARQDIPFEKLVETLAPPRDASRNPLFQICFALQTGKDATLQLDGADGERIDFAPKNAKFDLTLILEESGEAFSAVWEYCTDLFESATIERMARHFTTLIDSILSDPDQPISTVALMDPSERRQVLADWNETATAYPSDTCLQTLIEAQVERTPQAVAVLGDGRALTYAELNARANQLARYLRRVGGGPRALIGVYLEPGPDMVVGLLGILKAGCAYVPLDPHLPLERLTFMVQDAGVPVVVTTSGLQSDVPSRGSCRLVCIDSDWREIATESATDVALETNARDLAYVMYTSGSTGKPKGACITHRGLVNYLTWTIGAYDVSSGAAIPLIASIAFDLSVTCLFAPLIVGRAVHMPGRPYDVESILAAATDYSLLMISPAHLPLLAQAAGVSRAATLARAFIVGGEQLRGEALSFWRQHAPALRIINEFGPTETVVACCTYEVTPEAPAHGAIPIGRPIANTRLYVLDRYRQPVPIGVPGELYIGGVGVARGYWNRPELSAERFLADPFVADNEARLYRTGDLVRYRPDGNLEFLARLDSQVQLRGFRIELGEVEAVIAEYPGIRDVAVVVREDRNDDERLAAYIVSAAETTIDLALLRSTIRAQLPAYMVPSSFVVLDRLPLMANGKVDRRALPEPDRDRGAFIGALVPARDEIEQILCRVWAEILGVEQVGIDDNFFDLGGHSLLAAKLFARLDKACGYSLPLSSLFAAPTVRDLADLYRQSGKTVLNSTLIQLTASGTHVPIYAVPGAYGNVVFYGALARSLGPDQPFYALEAVGLDGATAPLHSIEEIATFNLRQIRALQPHSPYIILGACFGATVAYEMAQQILSEGEGIALLGLFDPIRREAEKPKRVVTSRILGAGRLAAIWRFAAGRGVLYYDDMRSLGWVERAAYLGRKLLPIGRNAKGGFQDIEREVNQLQVYWANADAQDRYHRKPLASGDLRNFVVVQDSYRAASKRTDWAKLWTGRIDHYVLPGRDSGDLFRGANVQSIAAILAARLTPPALRARSPRPGSSW